MSYSIKMKNKVKWNIINISRNVYGRIEQYRIHEYYLDKVNYRVAKQLRKKLKINNCIYFNNNDTM